MAFPVMGRTEGATNWVIDKSGTRRSNATHDVVRRADDQRRNVTRFNDVSDETDGLMAERSVGHQ